MQSPATFSALRVGQLLYPQEQSIAAVKVKQLSKKRVMLTWLHEPGETVFGKVSFNKGRWCVDAFDGLRNRLCGRLCHYGRRGNRIGGRTDRTRLDGGRIIQRACRRPPYFH